MNLQTMRITYFKLKNSCITHENLQYPAITVSMAMYVLATR